MICSKCGYKSPEGMGTTDAFYHHNCVMKNKCPLIRELPANIRKAKCKMTKDELLQNAIDIAVAKAVIEERIRIKEEWEKVCKELDVTQPSWSCERRKGYFALKHKFEKVFE